MEEQEIDKRVERAVENFMAGYGCCQSVVAAFADGKDAHDVWSRLRYRHAYRP